ncbi:MAG: CPBP family intramembrane metalloprotease [Lactobacillales bacterium]|nr:CPBP family intramembrane metalloprotease [Lactobacillales bacterium]
MNGRFLGEIVSSSVKVILWIIPSIYLIQRYRSELTYSLKELFSFKIKWSAEIWMLFIYVFSPLIKNFLSNGTFIVNKHFEYSDLIWISIVGIAEEIVFRGWIQNVLMRKFKIYSAMIITNILFVIIHFPKLIQEGGFPDLHRLIAIFVLGTIFSYSFYKTKNLWTPILFHTLWDLFVTVF